ncbi:MAG: 30S ribosomal protein S16 [Balneola sp.]|nr:30S ribosomal protein S16 [Balneola sp.]
MIKIRLQRKGRIRRPIYHIVVADSRSPRDGRIIEQVGRYDGVTEKKETIINEERISYWLDQGAKPTDAVQKILRHQGFLYKRHLQMWGKSEEEINAAIEEWKANRESKEQAEVSRKDQVRASLIAEEKEVKKQIKQKVSAVAAEIEKEAEETAAEAAAEQVEPAAEETADPKTETETEAAAEQVEPAAEETADPKTETEIKQQSGKKSVDMSAKEAVNHIAASALENLDGFVTDSEVRKTVLAAWEAKKNTK